MPLNRLPSIFLLRTTPLFPQFRASSQILLRAAQLRKMASTSASPRTYETAIAALNSLQTNAGVLAQLRAKGQSMNELSLPEMREWCSRAGYTPKDLNRINFIHISGTKGKGSTSAFISHILSQYSSSLGPVGLYTSPHLRSVRERIRLGNKSISETLFTKYFYEVWDSLEKAATEKGEDPNIKPGYFRFLTVLAFWVFLREEVKVVVLEVGLGGEYDATNIIESPLVTGITPLGLDHVAVLGNTIEEIAWHKAGIMKKGVECFSASQPEKAREVLRKRVEEREAKGLKFVEGLGKVKGVKLGLNGDFQASNAALATEISLKALKLLSIDPGATDASTQLPELLKKGLETTVWPGRCQILERPGNPTFYLDGAHTYDSVLVAAQWFSSILSNIPPSTPITLIFNQQERDAVSLLRTLFTQLPSTRKMNAIFCTNTTFKDSGYSPELVSLNTDPEVVKSFKVQRDMKEAWDADGLGNGGASVVLGTIEEAVEKVEGDGAVLVCGSLHLVGGVLEVLGVEV